MSRWCCFSTARMHSWIQSYTPMLSCWLCGDPPASALSGKLVLPASTAATAPMQYEQHHIISNQTLIETTVQYR